MDTQYTEQDLAFQVLISQFIFLIEQRAHISVQNDDEIVRMVKLGRNNGRKKKN